jgi:hypothetical protein
MASTTLSLNLQVESLTAPYTPTSDELDELERVWEKSSMKMPMSGKIRMTDDLWIELLKDYKFKLCDTLSAQNTDKELSDAGLEPWITYDQLNEM